MERRASDSDLAKKYGPSRRELHNARDQNQNWCEEHQAKDRQNDVENSLAPARVKSLLNFQLGGIRCANAAFGLRKRRLMPMHGPPWLSLAGIRARFRELPR